MAYVGPTSNVRVERASCECFGEGSALAELITLFEKSVDKASRVEDDRKLIETNDDNNTLRGIEVLFPFNSIQAVFWCNHCNPAPVTNFSSCSHITTICSKLGYHGDARASCSSISIIGSISQRFWHGKDNMLWFFIQAIFC